MADAGDTESPKRSRVSAAKSLLRRDRSRDNRKSEDGSSVGDSHELRSGRSSPRPGKLQKRSVPADAKPEPAAPSTSNVQQKTVTTLNPQDAPTSIEQSVKMFKVFDVLRNGDGDAITKAVAETSQDKKALEGTTILHLAIQCAEPVVVEQVIGSALTSGGSLDINAQDREGNTPLHLAAMLGRPTIVRSILETKQADSAILNYQSRSAIDLAKTPEIFQLLQVDRAMFTESQVSNLQQFIARKDYVGLENLLADSRVNAVIDVNGAELSSDPVTVESGGSLLHEAARKRDIKLIEVLLLNGADPFRRDRYGKLPQDATKDDRTRAILKKSPAATAAQRGIQERAILGNSIGGASISSKESREIKGYLKKWTNYTSGYKLRWFVLEDGVLSYYKHQDDAGSACRGAMNMRIARLSMDPQDKTRFEIQGKSSVKYHLKANHTVEAKRWFWALNNAIQWSKDEAKEERQRHAKESESARLMLSEHKSRDGASLDISTRNLATTTSSAIGSNAQSTISSKPPIGAGTSIAGDDQDSTYGPTDSVANDFVRIESHNLETNGEDGEEEEEEYGDDDSSHHIQPAPKDAFNITAHSANLQLDLLAQVSSALQKQASESPDTALNNSTITQAISTYEGAVKSLKGMVGDLLRIAKDRDAYWQYRLDREADMRRLWEDSMTKVAREHEALEGRIGESEEKRKRTKKALREALEETGQGPESSQVSEEKAKPSPGIAPRRQSVAGPGIARRGTLVALEDLSDDETDVEEFFDAVDAGEVPVENMPKSPPAHADAPVLDIGGKGSARETKLKEIEPSFKGYEDPVRTRLAMEADNRPTISLWSILKSMIGKDMTKMTLPVSFNEPTSLLQRVAEDMEYTDLLDTAADRQDSLERMVYVAAFAASEYASTIGRVAKPFNPLLGETYEYARPDKGYRFFIEQVSHHPPIGAAWAESPRWDYYGESAVKSKFYGKSFDINPLGTWFLKLRPSSGTEELYTWKKVTSSVIGIITGSPTVDNYGPMEIKNWRTGETCLLEFKARGWKASSAYQMSGKVNAADGTTKWSIGGRWNDKIYARPTPGFVENMVESTSNQAFLVWEAHKRPTGIPFNLTPFVLTLNALPDRLRPVVCPTDTRLRPDQRAMEDGEYELAATEKNRVEEKQRAVRRVREIRGEEFVPRWFGRGVCETTGEEFWLSNGEYWRNRERVAVEGGEWERVEDIF